MGKLAEDLSGFATFGTYLKSLTKTVQYVAHRPWMRRSYGAQSADKAKEIEMKRCMNLIDLICVGPGVILSYLVAGISALLSSICYAEFSANMPLAGGAYSYIVAVFGEFAAYITVANLIFEYILANAAIIRGLSPYVAMLFNVDKAIFYTAYQQYQLDWLAFGICIALTILLTIGTRETAWFNLGMNIMHIVLVLFIIIAGFVGSKTANAQPFLPYGIRGVFDGAAIVFFSYIGFDAVANSAEEVRNPSKVLPLGILGALAIVTSCYLLMSAVLVLMVPYDQLDSGAPFAAAFSTVGMNWGRYIVALGALMGIITSTMVGMYATARIICSVARQHMLPPFFARIHPKFKTPAIATVCQGIACAMIGLFTDFAELVDMVSISTLFAFWVVALALIWNRHYVRGVTPTRTTATVATAMLTMIASSIAFVACYKIFPDGSVSFIASLVATAAVFLIAVAILRFCCKQYCTPGGYGVLLFPLTPAVSMFINTFLLGQLNHLAFIRFAIWTGAITVVYLFYSMHASAAKEDKDRSLPVDTDTKDAKGVVADDVKDAAGPGINMTDKGGFVVHAS
eukprot:gene1934-2264_t